MDGFNPYRNIQAGKKVSVGAIYMVCLNLPPEIRYRFENMYLVGVIPGPSEPSLDQINHMLKPLVDDLLQFWSRGIFYPRTPRHPAGRRIHIAMIPLVCDLPAARQMGGFASYGCIHFCSMCTLRLREIDNTDVTNWTRRTGEEHRRRAEEWKDAGSKEREKLFIKHGVRYSELLRLPYWDPVLFTLVDSMHAFFLIDLRRHCRDVWGMDVKLADGDGSWVDPGPQAPSAPSDLDIRLAWRRLETQSEKILNTRTSLSILQHLCRETHTLPEARHMKHKARLVAALKQYVCVLSCTLYLKLTH